MLSACAPSRYQLTYSYQIPFSGGRVQVIVADILGSSRRRLFNTEGELIQVKGWVMDGRQFMVQSKENDHVYLFDPNFHQLGECLSCGIEPRGRMIFSPSGEKIAILRDNGIFMVMGADNIGYQILDHSRVGYWNWSHDEQSVTFLNWEEAALYRINVDGSNLANLTGELSKDQIFDLSLSLSESALAFHELVDGQVSLMLMDDLGSEARRLTEVSPPSVEIPSGENIATTVQWSADGETIVFTILKSRADLDTDFDIFVINRDGTELRNLTNNPANDWSPVWSPDGKYIAFISDRDGSQDIWIINADGSEPINISDTPDLSEFGPFWRQ